jgi:hypothetical protein
MRQTYLTSNSFKKDSRLYPSFLTMKTPQGSSKLPLINNIYSPISKSTSSENQLGSLSERHIPSNDYDNHMTGLCQFSSPSDEQIHPNNKLSNFAHKKYSVPLLTEIQHINKQSFRNTRQFDVHNHNSSSRKTNISSTQVKKKSTSSLYTENGNFVLASPRIQPNKSISLKVSNLRVLKTDTKSHLKKNLKK